IYTNRAARLATSREKDGEDRLSEESRAKRYERLVLPHTSAAYNLARWLLGNAQNAEDVTQEACLRAFKHLDRLHGEEARAWLLTIVRNECYDWIRQHR